MEPAHDSKNWTGTGHSPEPKLRRSLPKPIFGDRFGCWLIISIPLCFVGFALIRLLGTPFPASAHVHGYCLLLGRGSIYWCFGLWQYVTILLLMAPFAVNIAIALMAALYQRLKG